MTLDEIHGRELVLAAIDRIPMLSTAVVELLGLLQGDAEDLDADAVKTIVEKDPGLSVRILSIANSALYSRGFEISSIDGALGRLGFKKLTKIALEASLENACQGDLSGYGMASDDLWMHAVATSFAARSLVSHLDLNDDGTLHAAGLLHNFGRIALSAAFGEDLLSITPGKNQTFVDAELEACGIDSTEATACLLEHWRLPKNLVDSVRFLHHPEDAPSESKQSAEVIHLANHISNCGGWGVGREGTAFQVSMDTLHHLNVGAGIIEEVLEETMIEMNTWRSER